MALVAKLEHTDQLARASQAYILDHYGLVSGLFVVSAVEVHAQANDNVNMGFGT